MGVIVSVNVSSDAQVAWLAIVRGVGGATSLNDVAAAIAYHVGRHGGEPPESEDGWEKRAQAALSELLLQDLVETVTDARTITVDRQRGLVEEKAHYKVSGSGRLPNMAPEIGEEQRARLARAIAVSPQRPTALLRMMPVLRNPRRYR